MTLYYWEKEIHQAHKIHSLTKIPIYYNIRKRNAKHREGNGHKKVYLALMLVELAPTVSPDTDPIENLWNIVKTNVERRKPKNCRKLEWL